MTGVAGVHTVTGCHGVGALLGSGWPYVAIRVGPETLTRSTMED